MPKPPGRRPRRHPILEHLTARLLNDGAWQAFFCPREQRVVVQFAKRYWSLQITAGFSVDEMYARVVRMLLAVEGGGRRMRDEG